MYSKGIKSDSTMLASMVWSRLTAADGPEVWGPSDSLGAYRATECAPDGWPELRYDIPVIEHTSAVTIRLGWGIIVVLGLYPAILFGSLLRRICVQSLTPVGEGFGLVSLMASVDKGYLQLLEGASLSGKLRKPIFVGFDVGRGGAGSAFSEREKVTTLLGTQELRSGLLRKKAMYR